MNLLRGLILIVFSVAMSLAIVWQRARLTQTRYKIGAMQKEIGDLEIAEQLLHLEVSLLKSPKVIAQRVETMQLGLRDPSGCKLNKKRTEIGEYKLIAMRTREKP
ncbi:MAG: hypothetical protein GXP25_04320 [Planctomycetes bacterium]|nr:hypothetical protein [Planctomycetota bacterium]